MNKKLRKALKESFNAPAPTRKKEFLCNIQEPSISNFEFIRTQAAYIRKRVWGISILIFASALIASEWIERDMLWCISAFMPLLALALITECGRAEVYGMAEFELSTRFSIKSVVLARLEIIGSSTLILLCIVTPFIAINSKSTLLGTGVYITCPYLLTAFLGFWVVRKIHGKESFYFCTGIATMVSFINIIIPQRFSILYDEQNFIWWNVALVILCVGTTSQCYKMIKQTEELAWNL